MPIFEYNCKSCDHHFETLVFNEQTVSCPTCESQDLEKTLSVFAVANSGSKALGNYEAMSPCGSCGDPRGAGSCSMN